MTSLSTTAAAWLDRLAALDTNSVSDALDLLNLPGATVGLRPLWNCPAIVGRATTVQFGPRSQAVEGAHPGTTPIDGSQGDDRVLVIGGGLDGVSSWGDVAANAAQIKRIRGTVLDGFSRDIGGSEAIGYPVYGRGVTMVSARNRVKQIAAGEPLVMAGVTVRQDDYVIADRCGTVFIEAARVAEVVALAERVARRQEAMIEAVRAGQPLAQVMNDRELEAMLHEGQQP